MPRQCFTGTLPIPDGCGHAASGTFVGKAGQSPESPVVENAAPMHSIDRVTTARLLLAGKTAQLREEEEAAAPA